ncbi:MAG: HDOD domain-containing protein [Phycisphaerales bacterium]
MGSSSLDQVLGCQSLPTLPTIAVQLLELTRDPKVSMTRIGKLVKSDVGLSAKVLRTVNSSFFCLKQPCSTIDRALAYLGLNTVKSLVLGFSLVDSAKNIQQDSGFDLDAYWKRTIYAATATRTVAEFTRACDPDEAFTAGLFQDMGMMAMFVAIPEEYVPLLAEAESHEKLREDERRELGFDHAVVGAELAKKWKLQEAMVECIANHHEPENASPMSEKMVRCVALGRIAAEAILAAAPGRFVVQLKRKAREWFESDEHDVAAMMDRLTDAAQELARLFEKDISPTPDITSIMSSANDALLEHQISVQRETAELRAEHERLEHKASTDPLTGITNRASMQDQLPDMFEQALSGGAGMAVLFMDGDKFKSINDTFGHQAGDLVLKELASRLASTVGQSGVACRYGGEEFAVLLPGLSMQAAQAVGERVRSAIERTPFDLSSVSGGPSEHRVTVSVGVSATDLTEGAATTAEQLVHQADLAVYAAKRQGRNRVVIYSPEVDDMAGPPAPLAAPEPQTANTQPAKSVQRTDPATAPKPEVAPQRTTTPAPVSPHGSRQKVLLLEDDSLAAALIQATFKRHAGVEIVWAKSIRQASAYIAKHTESLGAIITDIHLPDGQAYDMVRSTRQSSPHLAIYMISAASDDETKAAAIDAGATKFIDKLSLVKALNVWAGDVVSTMRAA